jgi:hypothetical protein
VAEGVGTIVCVTITTPPSFVFVLVMMVVEWEWVEVGTAVGWTLDEVVTEEVGTSVVVDDALIVLVGVWVWVDEVEEAVDVAVEDVEVDVGTRVDEDDDVVVGTVAGVSSIVFWPLPVPVIVVEAPLPFWEVVSLLEDGVVSVAVFALEEESTALAGVLESVLEDPDGDFEVDDEEGFDEPILVPDDVVDDWPVVNFEEGADDPVDEDPEFEDDVSDGEEGELSGEDMGEETGEEDDAVSVIEEDVSWPGLLLWLFDDMMVYALL